MEDLTRLLDLDGEEKGEPCPAVITQVTTCGGFGPTTLWTWLNARVARDRFERGREDPRAGSEALSLKGGKKIPPTRRTYRRDCGLKPSSAGAGSPGFRLCSGRFS